MKILFDNFVLLLQKNCLFKLFHDHKNQRIKNHQTLVLIILNSMPKHFLTV